VSRPPIPAPIQHQKGYRATRAIEKTSIAQEGRPAVPKFLSPEEKQRFRQMCKQLEDRRTLTKADGELLTIYVRTWSRWRLADKDVVDRGPVVVVTARGKNDEVIEREKPNPYLAIAETAEKTMIACLDRLGFTPLNREHVKPVKKDETKVPAVPGTAAWLVEQAELTQGADERAN
jgi:P27 family predicted phage terminase small subunit